jgi:transcription termination factor Rho
MASSNESDIKAHTRIAQLAIERAKRLVEMGKDVFVLMDSLTRIGRAFNNAQGGGGRTMSGGVDSRAHRNPAQTLRRGPQHRRGRLPHHHGHRPHRDKQPHGRTHLPGVQRHRQHGDRPRPQPSATSASTPPSTSSKSGTRREENLYHPDELARVIVLRKQLNELPAVEAMETLVRNLHRTKSNAELLLGGLR